MSRKMDKPEQSLNLFVILVLFAFFMLCIHYAGAIGPWAPQPTPVIEPLSKWKTGPSAEDVSRAMIGKVPDIERVD